MEILPGLSVSLFTDKVGEILVDADGYIGEINEKNLTLFIDIDEGREDVFFPFMMDGKKNISTLKKLAPEEEGQRWYESSIVIPIQESNSGLFFTTYPANTARVVELGENGKTVIRRISVFSQDGEFFLAHDVAYDVVCYRGFDKIACPALRDDWYQMAEWLGVLWQNRIGELPDIAEYHPILAKTEEFAENTGKVLWWSHGMGLGCILTEQGEVRVHQSKVFPREGERCRFLKPGETVKFDRLEPIKKNPKRPSNFTYEAIAVQVI